MAAEQGSPSWPSVLRSQELQDKVRNACVLCVGAGGIGCELLKTLVCSGFRNIEVIDLDTIETSNLNRQFLFRKHHVGQSKAATAAQVVRSFAPQAEIVAHHANVKEGRFDVDFFKRFDLVLNGLDNLEARRHVNRLCLAAERPLVESGTAGYLGQVTVHLKGETECFECQPKPTPKTFPICTLRNTPDKPIHCIVWAKDLLFNRLFGRPEVSDLDDQSKAGGVAQASGATAAEPAQGAGEAVAAAGGSDQGEGAQVTSEAEDPSFFELRQGEAVLDYAQRVFERVYATDIERLRDVKELWEKRPPPEPLHLAQVLPDLGPVRAALEAANASGSGASSLSASRALGLANPNQKWSTSESASVLLLAIALYRTLRQAEVGSAVFDKDDDLAVDFVTAAANLRSTCYGIPTQSLFDAKGMAGNIIHAIATTNAIISGLIVIEALKLLAGCRSACRNSYLNEVPVSKKQLSTVRPEPPAKGCMVCGKAQLTLRLNTQAVTLGMLVASVLKKALAINTPNLLCGGFMYEEGEGLEEDEVAEYAALLPRPLAALPGGGLGHGSILTVQDQTQHFTVDLIILHQESLDPKEHPEGFILEGDAKAQQQQQDAEAAASQAADEAAGQQQQPAVVGKHAAPKEDDEGVVLLDLDDDEPPPRTASKTGTKRAREEGDGDGAEDGAAGTKKSKTGDNGAAAADDDDVVEIMDD